MVVLLHQMGEILSSQPSPVLVVAAVHAMPPVSPLKRDLLVGRVEEVEEMITSESVVHHRPSPLPYKDMLEEMGLVGLVEEVGVEDLLVLDHLQRIIVEWVEREPRVQLRERQPITPWVEMVERVIMEQELQHKLIIRDQ